mgnify:CR=1 FL=1
MAVDVPSLPGKLEALLILQEDQPFASRCRMVFEVASRAIAAMGELDLVQYEEPEVEGSADLSMWEKVAPIIASTIAEVNTFAAQVEASFPPGQLLLDAGQLQIESQFHGAAVAARADVMSFGQRVRDPSVVGERWNLITELQIFRFHFRDALGKLVWEVAQVMGECKRREVEPGYEEALNATLVVRTMTTDLRRLMRARIQRVGDAAGGDLLPQAQQMEKELNAFGRTAAWRALRAQDKKGILEFRGRLRQLMAAGAPSKLELLALLEPFVEFVDEFANISRRELLVQHDQEVLAAVGVVLERAINTSTPEEKEAAFRQALDLGQTLYGRSAGFDTFLRAQRKLALDPGSLSEQLEQFLVQIAGLTVY